MVGIGRLAQSFRHAFRGVILVFKEEQSFRIQTIAAIGALVCAALLGVKPLEWLALLIVIAAVLVLELINSVFERLIDAFKPRLHPAVRDMKDVMAGVVLLASIVAVAVGVIVFLPRILPLLPSFGRS